MTAGVYLLRDPSNGIVRYVGQSANVEQRIYQHLSSKSPPGRLSKWLNELFLQGMRPVVSMVEVRSEHGRDKVELNLVSANRATIFNGTTGGKCGYAVAERGGSIVRPGKVIDLDAVEFYRARNRWSAMLCGRLIRLGADPRSIYVGVISDSIRTRCSNYALKLLKKNDPERFGCYQLADGYRLVAGV
jgi:hypothetical protein